MDSLKTKLLEKLEDYLLKFQDEYKETGVSACDATESSYIGQLPDAVSNFIYYCSFFSFHLVLQLLFIRVILYF